MVEKECCNMAVKIGVMFAEKENDDVVGHGSECNLKHNTEGDWFWNFKKYETW